MELQHKQFPFICTGLQLNLPSNILEEGKFPFLQNIIINREGVLESHLILTSYVNSVTANTPNAAHSIFNLKDSSLSQSLLIFLASTKLYSYSLPSATIAAIDTGFSGNPTCLISFRPKNSVSPFLYIADANKFKKISNLLSAPYYEYLPVGLKPPNSPAIANLDKPARKTLDNFTAGWGFGGSASAPTYPNRFNTTITSIILDDAAVPCWANIILNSFSSSVQEGAIATLSTTEDVVIEETLKTPISTTTISSIQYETGSTGKCIIQLTLPSADIKKNSILKLDNGISNEYVRITEVISGIGDANATISFKTSTINTYVATNTVTGFPSFRCYTTLAHANGDVVATTSLKSVVTASGISYLDKSLTVDLTTTTDRPIDENDYIHFSVLLSDVSKLTELQIQLDFDETTNDFTKNYYYYPIRANDLLNSQLQLSSSLTTAQQVIQREQIDAEKQRLTNLYNHISRIDYSADVENISNPYSVDNPNNFVNEYFPLDSIPTQVDLGNSQWGEFKIPLKSFTRVGTDNARGWRDVKKIRFSFNLSAAIDVYIDALYIGGGFELSREGNLLYNYIVRARDASNGVTSNFSPPMRDGIDVQRGRIKLDLSQCILNLDFNSDKLDIFRYGGTIGDFHYVGTTDVSSPTFYDEIPDSLIIDNEVADFENYQSFAILDSPKSGICNIKGTKITRVSGDVFSTSYPQGVEIIINNIPNEFYSSPTSTSAGELQTSMGTLTNVPFYIPNPLKVGQTLPIIFGPFGEGESGLVIFGLGDTISPNKLYYLDGNSPDTQRSTNYIEITSPSEPLLNGRVYDTIPLIFTHKRIFYLLSTFSQNKFSFIARELVNNIGLYAKHALCVGKNGIYFLSKDGIYVTNGNQPKKISSDINQLFPRDGITPTSTIQISVADSTLQISPPDFTKLNDLRLYNVNGFIYFHFTDLNSQSRYMIYEESDSENKILGNGRWVSYLNLNNGLAGGNVNRVTNCNAIIVDEGEGSGDVFVGATDGTNSIISRFTKVSSSSFANAPDYFSSIILSPTFNLGNFRNLKEFKEFALENYCHSHNAHYQLILNFNSEDEQSIAVGDIATSTILNKKSISMIDFNSGTDGLGYVIKDFTLKLYYPSADDVKFYNLDITYIPRNETILNRSSDWYDLGDSSVLKFIQGLTITCDTFGQNKTLTFLDDDGVSKATLTINHNRLKTKDYSFTLPFISHQVKITSNDSVLWELDKVDKWDFDIEAPLVYNYETQEGVDVVATDASIRTSILGWSFIKYARIALYSTSIVTLRVTIDGIDYDYTIPSTGGIEEKVDLYLYAIKGKIRKYKLFSTLSPFRLYLNDCEFHIKQWGWTDKYMISRPFGMEHRQIGARI